jgi:hypothetical protein
MTNAAWVVVGTNGNVYAAPVGTAAPTTSVSALNAAFLRLGFVSEDGATFTEGKEVTDINAWQSFYPIRKLVTARTVEVSFALREFTKRNIQFALGGTVSGTAPGPYTYVPRTADQGLDTAALVLDWQDGTSRHYRLYIPQGTVTEAVESTITRTASQDLPVTFSAIDPGGGTPIYQLFTDDPSFSS